jgi:CRISPR type III-B/RAMP module RAMP protein Cmr1
MQRITVELEAITATFLHLEPRGEARWRAAPFRGLARWWFRAVVGAAWTLGEVRQREAALFGSAESPSPVVVRIIPGRGSPVRARVNPSGRPEDRGNNRYTFEAGALGAGARATLELLPASPGPAVAATLSQAYAALWVALHFGGVGQRSRRGAGSLRMVGVSPGNGPQPVQKRGARDHAEQLASGLARARAALGAGSLVAPGGVPDFPVLHPDWSEAWVVEGPGARGETEVRGRLMDARRGVPSHRTGAREPEFGYAGRDGRLASPVWVRVAEFTPERTTFVVTLLRHGGARRANWGNVTTLLEKLGSTRIPVELGRTAP